MAHTRHAHGPLVRALREAHGLTLIALATKAGMSTGQLSRIEHGHRRATWSATLALARTLDVDAVYLTGTLPPLRPLRHLVIDSDPQAIADYAASLGLSVTDLYDIELGVVVPTAEQLELFAQRLGVPIEALVVPIPEETS
jgi:transcriptional regulator with XRE-family HTH domain